MDFSQDLLKAVHEIISDTKWQCVGEVEKLSLIGAFKLYLDSEDGDATVQLDDIVVFPVSNTQFYAIDCACPHEGLYIIIATGIQKFKLLKISQNRNNLVRFWFTFLANLILKC